MKNTIIFVSLSLGLFVLSGCAVSHTQPVTRIALMAPFEGRYREIGYQTLYPARVALQDANITNVELLAVDDGGNKTSAAERARALTLDPQVAAVILVGYDAASTETQAVLGDMPTFIVGHWSAQPVSDFVFIMSNPLIETLLDHHGHTNLTDIIQTDDPIIGGDVLALRGFQSLYPYPETVTIISSGIPPDDAFIARILASDPFAIEPGLLATTIYDTVGFIAQALAPQPDRQQLTQIILTQTHTGITGEIRFERNYRVDAPLFAYRYTDDLQFIPCLACLDDLGHEVP